MMKPVFIFKTTVATYAQIKSLKPKLDKLIQQADRWNFDLDDCDNILRVESTACNADEVIKTLQLAGYDCEELH